jgi:hypothetical protein
VIPEKCKLVKKIWFIGNAEVLWVYPKTQQLLQTASAG